MTVKRNTIKCSSTANNLFLINKILYRILYTLRIRKQTLALFFKLKSTSNYNAESKLARLTLSALKFVDRFSI